MSAQQVPHQRSSYRSPMNSWAERASVRSSVQTVKSEDLVGRPFSIALFPIVLHPAVEAKGCDVRDQLLARRALEYLDFTEELEVHGVTPTALALGRGELDLGFGADFQRDLYKVAIDEAHHAHETFDVRTRLSEIAELSTRARPTSRAACLNLLRQHVESVPESERPIVTTIFASVSETLITKILMQVPQDHTVMPLIRNKVTEHARDEARHHRIFTQVMGALWSGWSRADKDRYAPLFAEFMHAFLAPSLTDYWQWLRETGFPDAVAEQIVMETYTENEITRAIRDSAQASIAEMTQLGMLQHNKLADALGSAGLL